MRTYLLVLILIFILINDSNTERRRLPQWHIRMAQQQGPNTCAVEEVPELNKRLWTECKYWLRRQICGYQPTLRYECCEGYTRGTDQFGCPEVKPLRNLLETAQALGATQFIEYAIDSEIEFDLTQSESALTVFVPTNEAFQSLQGFPKRIFEANKRSTLMHHIIPGRIATNETSNDELLSTILEGQTLRMNRYPNNIYSINCVPIIRKDQLATNGIVHLIDEVLIPSKSWPLKSVPESLIEDGRFRELSQLFIGPNFAQEIQRIQGNSPYTLFAPYDEAFHKLSPNYLNNIALNSNSTKDLLKHHIIPHTICPLALISEHNLKTSGGDNIKLTCNTTGKYINGAKITGESILTANGIINVIDEVLIPNSVRTLYELVEMSTKLSAFKETLDLCPDLVNLLRDSSQSLSLFAPNNDAFEKLTSHQIGNLFDNCRLFINSHIIPTRLSTKSMAQNKVVNTLSPNHSITCKVTRKGFGIDSAFIEESDIGGSNGVLHIIDEILILP